MDKLWKNQEIDDQPLNPPCDFDVAYFQRTLGTWTIQWCDSKNGSRPQPWRIVTPQTAEKKHGCGFSKAHFSENARRWSCWSLNVGLNTGCCPCCVASVPWVHQGAIDEFPCGQSIVGHPNQGNPEAQPKRQGLGCQFILQWGSVDPIKPKISPLKRLSAHNFRLTHAYTNYTNYTSISASNPGEHQPENSGWVMHHPNVASIPVHRRLGATGAIHRVCCLETRDMRYVSQTLKHKYGAETCYNQLPQVKQNQFAPEPHKVPE